MKFSVNKDKLKKLDDNQLDEIMKVIDEVKQEGQEDIEHDKNMPMNDKIDKLMSYFEVGLKGKGKHKGFKLPAKTRTAIKRFDKKTKILIFYITNNNVIKPLVANMIHGFVKIEGNWYTVPTDRIIFWRGKIPSIILPEWQLLPESITPLSTKEMYKTAEKDKNLIDPQSYAIRAIKMEAALLGKKMLGGKMLIWVIIGGIAVAYFIFSGGSP